MSHEILIGSAPGMLIDYMAHEIILYIYIYITGDEILAGAWDPQNFMGVYSSLLNSSGFHQNSTTRVFWHCSSEQNWVFVWVVRNLAVIKTMKSIRVYIYIYI